MQQELSNKEESTVQKEIDLKSYKIDFWVGQNFSNWHEFNEVLTMLVFFKLLIVDLLSVVSIRYFTKILKE